MKVKPTEEIEQALRPVAKALDVEIYEVVFRQGKDPSLTVFLDTDREGGIDLDTCEAFHNAADPVLDELDPHLRAAVHLQRQQPGDRPPLQKGERLFAPYRQEGGDQAVRAAQGRKVFEAVLLGCNYAAGNIEIDKGGEVFKLNLSQIVKISEAIEFD